MHSLPWWGELAINAIFVLASWKTWVVVGLLALGFVLWKKRHKKS
jgi:uncharacterized membrane-anchored protein